MLWPMGVGRRGAASLHLQVLVEVLALALVLHVGPVVGLHAQRAARLLRPVCLPFLTEGLELLVDVDVFQEVRDRQLPR